MGETCEDFADEHRHRAREVLGPQAAEDIAALNAVVKDVHGSQGMRVPETLGGHGPCQILARSLPKHPKAREKEREESYN